MYQLIAETGVIVCPDGYQIAVPYEHETDPEPAARYQAYADWVLAGNEPELLTPGSTGIWGWFKGLFGY
jgi:hypothetical protein